MYNPKHHDSVLFVVINLGLRGFGVAPYDLNLIF